MTPAESRAEARLRLRLALQGAVARALAPVTLSASWLLLRLVRGYRIEGVEEARAEYRRLRRESEAPLLVCANHLTMIDSALVAWALASPWAYLRDFAALPWNAPERTLFAASRVTRALTYALKCLPIERGGAREGVAGVLRAFAALLGRGEVGLLFPEGGRSRSGRVEVESAAYGVGRVVRAVPGCRVLCVYLRGERQEGHGVWPAWGDRLRVALSCIEPKSEHGGLRGSRDVARQITARLAAMEREHFDAR